MKIIVPQLKIFGSSYKMDLMVMLLIRHFGKIMVNPIMSLKDHNKENSTGYLLYNFHKICDLDQLGKSIKIINFKFFR